MNFRKILKRISWVVLLTTVTVTLTLAYIVTLVRYAETETNSLNDYRTSILAMPEVDFVHSVHRFNGLESYVVATITHESGEHLYFFIRDGGVQHFFFTTDLINHETANAVARGQLPNGSIRQTQLGIIEETPIFEIQVQHEGIIHYIIIHAETSEIIMQFYT